MIAPVFVNKKEIKPHKAHISANFEVRNVLTNSVWEFVALWLRRNGFADALFYWDQAKNFSKAAIGMPIESAPLLHYYSFMNAAKALLSAKAITFDQHHGVMYHNLRNASQPISLSNEGIKIRTFGIARAIANYFGDKETNNIHNLQNVLFNIPWIHRTYCLTYSIHQDLFIPLRECAFEYNLSDASVRFKAKIVSDFSIADIQAHLPSSIISRGLDGEVVTTASTPISSNTNLSPADFANISLFNNEIRHDIKYINGINTLWYLKLNHPSAQNLQRSTVTLALIAMHRLSEICRYNPTQLESLLSGPENWLLIEFINMASTQFIDEIASEITGYQFLLPSMRNPS